MSPPPRRGGAVFYGWVVVGAASCVLFLAYGTQFAFGIFFQALLDEFGWNRASLSGVFSLYTLVYAGFGLAAGRLTDRWGPRPVIAGGGLLLGAGLAGMSQTQALWHPFLLYGAVAALGMSTAYVPCNATVVRWFVRRRGLAVGLASAGGSLGAFALPPVAHLLVSRFGWRAAYVVFGTALALTLAGLATLMRRDPDSLGLLPDGDRPGAPASRVVTTEESGWTAREAVTTAAFWLLLALYGSTWTPLFVPLVHLVPHARDLGVPAFWAASLISFLGIAAVVGRLLMGALSDRVGRRPALALALALQAVAFLGFWAAGASLPGLAAAAVAFGFSYGAVSTLFPAVVGDFFGRAHAGTLVGLLFTLAAPLAAVGPLAAGWIYDDARSYDAAWWASAGFNLLALALLGWARPPVRQPARRPAALSSRSRM